MRKSHGALFASRTLLVLLMLPFLILACGTTADETKLPFEAVAQGAGLGPTLETPALYLASEPGDVAALSGFLTSDDRALLSQVDLDAYTLMVVFAGAKSSDGYGISVQDVTLEDELIEVMVALTEPPPSQPVHPAVTLPYQAVQLPRKPLSEHRPLEWVLTDSSHVELARGSVASPAPLVGEVPRSPEPTSRPAPPSAAAGQQPSATVQPSPEPTTKPAPPNAAATQQPPPTVPAWQFSPTPIATPPPPAAAGPIETILQEAPIGTGPVGPRVYVASSPADLAAFLPFVSPEHRALVSGVDLRERFIVAAFAGLKPTSGYGITIEELRPTGDVLTVVVSQREPEAGEPVLMAFTSPYHVVAASRQLVDPQAIRAWVLLDSAGRELARSD